jgi:hypothetical protein
VILGSCNQNNKEISLLLSVKTVILGVVYYGDVDHPISGQIDPGVS